MYERNLTKNILTKNMIAKELLCDIYEGDIFSIIFSLVFIAFVGIIFFLIYFAGLRDAEVHTFVWVIYFLFLGFFLLLPLFFIFTVLFSGSTVNKIKNGEIFVFTDDVYKKEEKRVVERRRIHIYNTIYFSKYGEVRVNNSVWYQLTSPGDSYYIVVLSKDATSPRKYYPCKMYEYHE